MSLLPIEPLDVTICRWYLGELLSEVAPRLASEMLEMGYDVPSLRVLAGVINPTFAECDPLLTGALAELGLRQPTPEEALVVVARFYAEQNKSIDGDPLGPANALVAVGYRQDRFEEAVLPFLGLTSQIEDYDFLAVTAPEPYRGYAAACREELRTTAEAFLAETASTVRFNLGPVPGPHGGAA
jgi:hypothetical protein